MVVKLYVSRTSGNVLMKVAQEHMKRVFDGKKIPYEEVDVADPHRLGEKEFMQSALKLSDDDLVALPPQIFKDNKHRGDYDSFFEAVEGEQLFEYLDLPAPPNEVEYQRKQHLFSKTQETIDNETTTLVSLES